MPRNFVIAECSMFPGCSSGVHYWISSLTWLPTFRWLILNYTLALGILLRHKTAFNSKWESPKSKLTPGNEKYTTVVADIERCREKVVCTLRGHREKWKSGNGTWDFYSVHCTFYLTSFLVHSTEFLFTSSPPSNACLRIFGFLSLRTSLMP